MAFQWLQMRISEEKDRREREASVLQRLPPALEELYCNLAECILAYTEAFGPEGAEISFGDNRIRITARDERNGRWEQIAAVEVGLSLKPQGFLVDRNGSEPILIELGLLPTGKLFYRHNEQYLTIEEMTRRILDRALFPKLAE